MDIWELAQSILTELQQVKPELQGCKLVDLAYNSKTCEYTMLLNPRVEGTLSFQVLTILELPPDDESGG